MYQWFCLADAYPDGVFDGVIISPFAQIVLFSVTRWEVLMRESM
jgi:hypothetical protein